MDKKEADRTNGELSEFKEKELLAPYAHLLQVRGKRLRAKIALAFNHWLQLPEDRLRYIVDTVDMLHNGTLLIDDIQDNSKMRRGLPAAHCVFGVPLTINASLHVIFLALHRILELGPKVAEIYAEEVLEIVRGQGIDIYWRDNFICPTEEEYKEMLKQTRCTDHGHDGTAVERGVKLELSRAIIELCKPETGHMFLLAVRLCQQFSSYKHDLRKLVLHMGLYFQIRDDYCNIRQQEALEEWPGIEDKARKDTTFCEDISEGKFSLPIIHAMKTPEREQILNILRQRTEDVDLKKYCVSLLEKAGSLKYTRDLLHELDRAARAEVARLGGNPHMEAVLDELMSWKD